MDNMSRAPLFHTRKQTHPHINYQPNTKTDKMQHSAWNLLFHNPEFWDHLTKLHMCCLTSTCKEFKGIIPEREVLMRVFRAKTMKKVELFRLLPLTANDVHKIKSPVSFTEAFQIAERKTKGFKFCMAIVRERGWRMWCEYGKERAERRHSIEETLRAQGVVSIPSDHPMLVRAVNNQISRIVVWRYTWRIFPSDRFAQWANNMFIYNSILNIIQQAHGNWYHGIHRETRVAIDAICSAQSVGTQYVHLAFANNILSVGIVTFQAD